MEVQADQSKNDDELGVTDNIARKLRGASSLVLMLYGEGHRIFNDMGDEWREGYLDTLLDLTEDARRLNNKSSH